MDDDPRNQNRSGDRGPGGDARKAGPILRAAGISKHYVGPDRVRRRVVESISSTLLRHLIAALPYKIHTVLTDNGTHFTTPGNRSSAAPEIKLALERGELFRAHAVEFACARNDIDHRLTKPKHPWTNGQVERMNRTLKQATVERDYYEIHDQLRSHLADFVTADNFAHRLNTLKGASHHTNTSARPG